MNSIAVISSHINKKQYAKKKFARKSKGHRGKYQKLSIIDKEKLFELVLKEKLPIVETAKTLNINLSTARLLIKNYKETHNNQQQSDPKSEQQSQQQQKSQILEFFHQKQITLDKVHLLNESQTKIKFDSYEKQEPNYQLQKFVNNNNHQFLNQSCLQQTINNIQINNIVIPLGFQFFNPDLITKLELIKNSINATKK